MKYLYLLFCVLFLLPYIGTSQSELDRAVSQLKSGDPLTVQEYKNQIITRWVTVYGSNPTDTWTIKLKQDLIKIINEDTVLSDTVESHDKEAQKALQKGDHYARDLALSDDKTAAISLVGILKIKEAIPSLVKHINYISPGGSSMGDSAFTGPEIDGFPAARSILMMEDTSSVPLLVDVVKRHPDEMTRRLAGKLVFRLEKEKRANSSLHQAYNLSTDSVERKNLGQVLGKN